MEHSGLDTRWTDHLRKVAKAKESPTRPTVDSSKAPGLPEPGFLEEPQPQDVSLYREAERSQGGRRQHATNKGHFQQSRNRISPPLQCSPESKPTSPSSAAIAGLSSHKRSAPADELSKAQGNDIPRIGRLSIDNKSDSPIKEVPMDDDMSNQPRKRAAIGEGLADRSPSTSQQGDSNSPRRSQAPPRLTPQASISKNMQPSRQSQNMRGTTGTGTSNMRGQIAGKTLFNHQTGSSFAKQTPTHNQNKPSHQATQPQQRGSSQPNKNLNTTPRPISTHPQPMFSILSKNSSSQSPPTPEHNEKSQMMRQPETRPISQEQLIAEVKGIYAGLVMVEARCIEVDAKHAAAASGVVLSNDQWQALIALHRTLLYEHHDFLLASQHPSASPALRKLATKYAMPARMWKHGIHSFLELLRHRLPASLDHMLAFIYLAYSMMALLYETVPAFEDTWIECLGDLGRYRMAIEDDDIRDRENWTNVARQWYSKASDKSPTTGRLYHHLAILARPNALQQIFYYSKSLSVAQPFPSARESVLTLFDPALKASQSQSRSPTIDSTFVKVHASLFTGKQFDTITESTEEFTSLLDSHIGRVTRKYVEQGYYIAVANSVALLNFGADNNPLNRCMAASKEEDGKDSASPVQETQSRAMETFAKARELNHKTLAITLERIGDPNVLPYLHVTLVFMLHMGQFDGAVDLLAHTFPWEALARFLNTLIGAPSAQHGVGPSMKFPVPDADDFRPFPEDWAMCGLLWTEKYFPSNWFSNPKIEDEEKYHEKPSMTSERKDRILYIACTLAKSSFSNELKYDGANRRFSSKNVLHQQNIQSSDMERQMSIDSVTEGAGSTAEDDDIKPIFRSDTLPTAITDVEETDEPISEIEDCHTVVQETHDAMDVAHGDTQMEG